MSTEPSPKKTKSSLRNEGKDRKTRNNANQRNFRSRQKSYVLELEEKVRAYERAGVTATKQVQAAARTVAAENAVLRSLTTAGLGWTEQELNNYISQRLGQSLSSFPTESHGNSNYPLFRDQERQGRPTKNVEQRPPPILTQSLPPVGNPPTKMSERESELGTSAEELASPSYDNELSTRDLPTASIAAPNGGHVAQSALVQDSATAPTPPNGNTPEKSPNQSQPNEKMSIGSSMSCEQAAAVLSGLRAQESLETIRETLGCVSSNTCTVTHWDLFQRMDDTIS